ncbi:MAG: hypothetical protein R3F14_11640 [Polyangiaceae bacterium]
MRGEPASVRSRALTDSIPPILSPDFVGEEAPLSQRASDHADEPPPSAAPPPASVPRPVVATHSDRPSPVAEVAAVIKARFRVPGLLLVLAIAITLIDLAVVRTGGEPLSLGPVRAFWIAGPLATGWRAAAGAGRSSPMTETEASELVADRFSRVMNATTSPLGVASDPPVAAAATAVFLVAYLAARRMDAPPIAQTVLLVLVAALRGRGPRRALLLGAPSRRRGSPASLCCREHERDLERPRRRPRDHLQGFRPRDPALNAKLDEIHTDCFVTDAKDQAVTVRIGVVEDKRNPAASNHRRYRRVRELVERVLLPLNAEHPIETVRVK